MWMVVAMSPLDDLKKRAQRIAEEAFVTAAQARQVIEDSRVLQRLVRCRVTPELLPMYLD
jgi:hypothetical protein